MTIIYTSSITLSALLLNPIDVRVSRATYQVLGLSGGGRVGTFFAEIAGLGGGGRASGLSVQIVGFGNAGARVSELYLQAIVRRKMPPPIYPTLGLGFSVFKRVKFSTGRAISASGRDVRVAYYSTPLWEWDLTYEYLPDYPANGFTPSDLKTLMGFFLAVSGGLTGFLFDDPDDNAVSGQVIGQSDGSVTQWLLLRTYGGSAGSGTEPIGWLNAAKPFHVYLDGVLQDPLTYALVQNPLNQNVRFNTVPAAGKVVSVDMGYYYYVKFKDDTSEYEKFMDRLWSQHKITLESLRG